MSSDSEYIDKLIARYLTGEASDDEKSRLMQWMNSSEENKKYFRDTEYTLDKTIASHKIIKVDVEKAWNKMRAGIHQKDEIKAREQSGRSFNIYGWIRVAAIILLVSGISFGLYIYYYSKGTPPVIVTSQNKTREYKLNDSTEVFMNRESKISFMSDFGKNKREVLLAGEAYFDVKHINDKPFIVNAGGAMIKDIGTSFNIKAYAGDSIVEVYVESGQVAFYTVDNPGILIDKGETGTFEKATNSFHKSVEEKPNILDYKNKVLIFQDARLSEVIEKLNALYQTNIVLKNQELGSSRITVSFENESIESVIGVIAETLNLSLTPTSDGFILDGIASDKH